MPKLYEILSLDLLISGSGPSGSDLVSLSDNCPFLRHEDEESILCAKLA
jgi:hypothetical protein